MKRAVRAGLALSLLAALVAVVPAVRPAPAAAATQASTTGWTVERPWGPTNDWEPNTAADPSSSWLYQMTTRYGGRAVCKPLLAHCIVFRASPNEGRTWSRDTVMPRRQCPPKYPCHPARFQNDPGIAVSRSGAIYATWMNGWDVIFMRSTDHGKTWGRYHDFRLASGASFTDKPWLAISPDGRDVYVAFNSSDSFVSASHDGGRTWSKPVQTNTDGLYWFAEGGAVAPNGDVYFSESAEHQNETGDVRLAVLSSTDGGATWTTTFVADSQQQPACPTANCPGDFYGAQISLGVDRSGLIMAAYAANTVAQAPMSIYEITSRDGINWSRPVRLSNGGAAVGGDFPKVQAGLEPGRFLVAWEDDRNGPQAWNVWSRATRDGGGSWSPTARVSKGGPSAPYKTTKGFAFPYGDYFGTTIDPQGTVFLIWGAGATYDGPGNTWWSARP